jgi:hypothetical protein
MSAGMRPGAVLLLWLHTGALLPSRVALQFLRAASSYQTKAGCIRGPGTHVSHLRWYAMQLLASWYHQVPGSLNKFAADRLIGS